MKQGTPYPVQRPDDQPGLDARQRKLVADNLGLIGHHLRRHVRGLKHPSREREWDDLFQEGCLGLMQAARSFDPASGIAFPAYARLRIQQAIHRGLRRAFETVRTPEAPGRNEQDAAPRRRIVSLDKEDRLPDRHAPRHPHVKPDQVTLGERLRHTIDEAVDQAARAEAHDVKGRAPSERVVRRLVEERLRVPREECRTPLRRISREASRSYASLAYVEKRLLQRVRTQLKCDVTLARLRHDARTQPDGWETVVRQRTVNMNQSDTFDAVWDDASERQRAWLVTRLIEAKCADVKAWATMTFTSLPTDQQRQLLVASDDGDAAK